MKSETQIHSSSVIVIASEMELPHSSRIWGSELWVPPKKREALDWLTLSRLLGWDVRIIYPKNIGKLRKQPAARCIVIACDTDQLSNDFVANLASLLQKESLLIVACAGAADSPFSRLSGSMKTSRIIEGHFLRWIREDSSKVWTCRNSLKSSVLNVQGGLSIWGTLEYQPVVAAKPVGRGTIATLGFHSSEARDIDGSVTALLKHLLIFGPNSPSAWLDLEGTVVLRMDDPGGAQNIHLKDWSYRKMAEDEWSDIGAALKARDARMTLGYVPGWVDDGDSSRGVLKVAGKATERVAGHIYPSPLVTYQDLAGNSPGTFHDYQSEFRGIQKLRALGLCEVELHGHTHIHPDTTGWAKSEDRYENPSWYHDLRVDSQKSSAAVGTLTKIISLLHKHKDPITLGLRTIKEYFGIQPTTLVCPQHIISSSAQERALEFDFTFINSNYLAFRDQDRWCWSTHIGFADFTEAASAWFDAELPVVANFHDRDVVEKGVVWFSHQLDAWRAAGAKRFIDFREFAAAVCRRLQLSEPTDGLLLHVEEDSSRQLVRPLSVLIRLPEKNQFSNISLIADNVQSTLPVHMLSDGLGRVIIPCSQQTVLENANRIRSGTIHVETNPISVTDTSGEGVATLFWESAGADSVEVHVNAPDGPLLSSKTPSGSFTTGKWVRDGMTFHLQDVTDGLPLVAENTLATVEAEVHRREAFCGNLIPFAAFLAEKFGCTHVIYVAQEFDTNKLVELQPQFELIGIGTGKSFEDARHQAKFGAWIQWDPERIGRIPLPEKILQSSIVLCDDAIRQIKNPTYLLENLRLWVQHSPASIVVVHDKLTPTSKTYDLKNLEVELESANLPPEFSGWISEDPSEKAAMAVLSGRMNVQNGEEKAPKDFKVVAIMTAYNEEDIVIPSLQRLIDQGILIYFIDNWSTDSTYDLAKRFEGNGIISLERFPQQETKQYNWGALLARVEEVATKISADWFIHHDIDEVRLPPWPAVSLRDGLYAVDRRGFNCIDHTVIEFHPVDNEFVPGSSFEKYFQYFEFSGQSGHFLQIKAWKNLGMRVSLANSGGHNAEFPRQRVFPYKFLLKHYPIRSQKQGEKKVFQDRKLRWNPEERAAGWHSHYDAIQPDHNFLRSRSDLELYDEDTFHKRYLVERLSGVGVNRKRKR